MKNRIRFAQESAVSPVVGVMLMLVVVIIIAAVVSAFAGGLGSGTEKAPQAAIDVSIKTGMDDTMGGTETIMTFTEISGDPIQTKDLAIITYYRNKAGIVHKNKQTATSTAVDLYGSGKTTRVPFINDMRYGYSGNNPAKDFGNYTWKTGDVLSTGNTAGTAFLLGINSTTIPYNLSDPDFGRDSIVDVKILHVPSGQYLFDREVPVK
ncbi:MAG: type IV pilin N-terminal domain-containing protein [Methanoregula sp.]|jgi:FlaG/FlaF family flagellin (archaellin)|nr:type IV pilin N-terminal domain-containing protein [Methanoregula sp.]